MLARLWRLFFRPRPPLSTIAPMGSGTVFSRSLAVHMANCEPRSALDDR